jgi:hypothetical protein
LPLYSSHVLFLPILFFTYSLFLPPQPL